MWTAGLERVLMTRQEKLSCTAAVNGERCHHCTIALLQRKAEHMNETPTHSAGSLSEQMMRSKWNGHFNKASEIIGRLWHVFMRWWETNSGCTHYSILLQKQLHLEFVFPHFRLDKSKVISVSFRNIQSDELVTTVKTVSRSISTENARITKYLQYLNSI